MNYLKFRLFIFILILVSHMGFSQQDSILVDTVTRYHLLRLPDNYSSLEKCPLHIYFHGFGNPKERADELFGFTEKANEEGYIMVYPGGLGGYWESNRDLQYVSQLIDSLCVNYKVDAQRIYASGFSNGGFFVNFLAHAFSYKFAAFADISGGLSIGILDNYEMPLQPKPFLKIHGTRDDAVAYNGIADSFLSADSLISYYKEVNDAYGYTEYEKMPDLDGGSFVERFQYDMYNSEITFYKITDGQHNPPGTQLNNVNNDISSADVLWEFFNRHPCIDNGNTIIELENVEYEVLSHKKIDLSWDKPASGYNYYYYNIYVNGELNAVTADTETTIIVACDAEHTIEISTNTCTAETNTTLIPDVIKTDTCPLYDCDSSSYYPNASNGAEIGQTPYNGIIIIPGTFETEHFDVGGNNTSFYEIGTTSPSIPLIGLIRSNFREDEAPYTLIMERNGSQVVSGSQGGEWAEYTINVQDSAWYNMSITYSAYGDLRISFRLDGKEMGCLYGLPNTNSFNIFATHTFEEKFLLDDGEHVFAWVVEDKNITLDKFEFTPAPIVGTNTINYESRLKAYPNPFNNLLNLHTKAKGFSLYDISGNAIRVSYNKTGQGYKLNTADLPSGIYFIKAGMQIQKIIKHN